jgi:hypothetical protein
MSSKYKKLIYTDRLVSTKLYKQKKKVHNELLHIFRMFQQFKIEIKKETGWEMDWENIKIKTENLCKNIKLI